MLSEEKRYRSSWVSALLGKRPLALVLLGVLLFVSASVLAVPAEVRVPVVEEHGWRVGRLIDPFGHEWEIGKRQGRSA